MTPGILEVVAMLGLPVGVVLFTPAMYGTLFSRRWHWYALRALSMWVIAAGLVCLGVYGLRRSHGGMDYMMAGMAMSGGALCLLCSIAETVGRVAELREWLVDRRARLA